MQFNEGVSIHLNVSNAERPHLMCHKTTNAGGMAFNNRSKARTELKCKEMFKYVETVFVLCVLVLSVPQS